MMNPLAAYGKRDRNQRQIWNRERDFSARPRRIRPNKNVVMVGDFGCEINNGNEENGSHDAVQNGPF